MKRTGSISSINKMEVKKLTETSSLNNSMMELSKIQNSELKKRIERGRRR